MKKSSVLYLLMILHGTIASASGYNPDRNSLVITDSTVIPISSADLGSFPFFNTLPNFMATDSTNQESNRTYFFDGKKIIVVDGRISAQNLSIRNSNEKVVGEFGCVDAFDKIIAHLGGVKIFTGKLPEPLLKSMTGYDLVTLGSKYQVAPSAFYGVVEYVIKTPSREVWVQLQPYSLDSKFYTLLVVERTIPLMPLNTNRSNKVLQDLEKSKKSTLYLDFGTDSTNLSMASSADLLQILGVYQQHPTWILTLVMYSASFGDPAYSTALTNKRALAIQQDLISLGVKPATVIVKGMGELNPLASNQTESGRRMNNRLEISVQ